MQTILVQIAAYRDSELIKTVRSCLQNAAHPDDLRFAIVNQVGPESAHLLDDYLHDPRFRIITCDWQTARGVGQARRQTNELYQGEDFYLQIDSHMRFLPNWDERLLAEWHNASDDKAIISSYPPAYKYDDKDQEVFISSKPNRLVVHEFYLGDIPIFFGKEIKGIHDRPVLSAFASGGLQFGPGRVCVEVPYEPDICFIGEEIVHSLRLFSYGYTVYAPLDQVVSHLYTRSQNQKDVHHFWHDFSETEELKRIYADMNTLSYGTTRAYLTGDKTLGPVRSRREFENFAGVDFGNKRVHADTYAMSDLPMAQDDSWRAAAIEPIKQS